MKKISYATEAFTYVACSAVLVFYAVWCAWAEWCDFASWLFAV